MNGGGYSGNSKNKHSLQHSQAEIAISLPRMSNERPFWRIPTPRTASRQHTSSVVRLALFCRPDIEQHGGRRIVQRRRNIHRMAVLDHSTAPHWAAHARDINSQGSVICQDAVGSVPTVFVGLRDLVLSHRSRSSVHGPPFLLEAGSFEHFPHAPARCVAVSELTPSVPCVLSAHEPPCSGQCACRADGQAAAHAAHAGSIQWRNQAQTCKRTRFTAGAGHQWHHKQYRITRPINVCRVARICSVL